MGYYAEFPLPIPHLGVRSIVLLTLSPLTLAGPFDLHVLAIPPAFNLSQDQTLQLISVDTTVLRRPRFDQRKVDLLTSLGSPGFNTEALARPVSSATCVTDPSDG